MKKLEKLFKMYKKAASGNENYMYIGCGETGAAAAMDDLGITRIKNATIIIQFQDEFLTWYVREGRVEQCPKKLTLAIKNMGILECLIGDVKNEQNCFSFGDLDESDSRIKFLIGVVEISSHGIAFLFDWNSKMVCSIEEDMGYSQDSQLFVLLETMRNLERRKRIDGREEQCSGEAYGNEIGWETNVQESGWEEDMQESGWEEDM